jgi:hypothetical protein
LLFQKRKRGCKGGISRGALDQRFQLFDEFTSHLWACVDFLAGFTPVCGATTIAGLFAYVFVYDFVDFVFICVCELHFGFF